MTVYWTFFIITDRSVLSIMLDWSEIVDNCNTADSVLRKRNEVHHETDCCITANFLTCFRGNCWMFCCLCVSRELLSAPTAGSRCFMKHLEQLEKASDTQTGELFHH